MMVEPQWCEGQQQEEGQHHRPGVGIRVQVVEGPRWQTSIGQQGGRAHLGTMDQVVSPNIQILNPYVTALDIGLLGGK